ncbi:D-alanine--D-alanine ligase B [bacterium HR39]|nr:D-alanine--D-alanine ligase B [bacterium HR39]
MKHVAVLMGGLSAEREISLVSGRACAAALEEAGYRVSRVDVGRDVDVVLRRLAPDVAFNALHGRLGEDGRIQGLLDLLRIPYTHSGVRASAIAMHKPTARLLFAAAGLPVAEGRTCSVEEMTRTRPLEPPVVVKPVDEGSSVGVTLLESWDALDPQTWPEGRELLVERFVPGHELTCAVLGDEPLAVTEIVPASGGLYDWRAKYEPGGSRHLLPAPLPKRIYERVLEISLAAHRVLGCRGVSRADLRWDPSRGEEGLVLLEVNTQPGMTPTSLLPEQAAFRGISFRDLVVRLVEMARCDP